ASGTEQIGMAVRSVNADVQTIAQVAGEMMHKAREVREQSALVRSEADQLLAGLGDFQLAVHRSVRESVLTLAGRQEMRLSVAQAEQLMRNTLAKDSRFELLYLVGPNGVQVSENISATDITLSY